MPSYTLLTTTKPYLHYVKWPLPDVMAFTTTRHSFENINLTLKESSGCNANNSSPYDFFNLGEHVGDSPEQVQANREQLQTYLSVKSLSASDAVANITSDQVISPNVTLPKVKIQWLTQVHQANVIDVQSYSDTPYVADAAVTRQPNVALAVMTADCLPILLVAKDGREVAAIHGGWRPLAKNIIKNTLMKMTTPTEDVYAWLGPCISQKAFEVGNDVKTEFIRQNNAFTKAFIDSANFDHSFADLHEIARIQLMVLGIKEISALPHCTYSQPQTYFSYRRENVTGRMASIIMINNK